MSNDSWRYTLDIDPMPAPRPRTRVMVVRGRPLATVYSPAEYKHWQADAHEQLIQQIDHPTITNPELILEIQITAQKPKTSKLRRPKPDVDNYAKAVMDAMTKAGVWEDDSQVSLLIVSKRWGPIGKIDIAILPVAEHDDRYIATKAK